MLAAPAAHTERRLSIGSMFSARHSLLASDNQLLGPKRPRPHKIWRKKYVKVSAVQSAGCNGI